MIAVTTPSCPSSTFKVGTVDAGAVDEGVDDLRRELLDILGNECQCRGGVDASGLDIASDAVVGPGGRPAKTMDAATVGSAAMLG